MITTEYTFWCQFEDCCQWEQFAMCSNKKNAKKVAKRQGWRKTKTGWICPRHALNIVE